LRQYSGDDAANLTSNKMLAVAGCINTRFGELRQRFSGVRAARCQATPSNRRETLQSNKVFFCALSVFALRNPAQLRSITLGERKRLEMDNLRMSPSDAASGRATSSGKRG
jgi:hypothetical protein